MVEQIVPQWQINQIFELTPDATTRQLRALVVGPAYRVQENAALGVYDFQQTIVDWPNRQAGEVVDEPYTSVEFRNAALRYATLTVAETIQTVVGKPNRLKSTGSFNWKTNGSFLRDSAIPFDPVVGDWVRVTNGLNSFVTSIVGFDGTVDPATPIPRVGDAGVVTADGDNAATQAASDTFTAGGSNTSDVTATEDASGYEGQAERALNETYTIEVLVGSETGNLGDVTLRVTSQSGTDPEQIIEGITYGVGTSIGSRGAEIVFSAGSGTPGDFTDDFITGDTWTWAIAQAYTAPTVTPAGTYTGETDTTYIVTVTRGGDWTAVAAADQPQISVTTSDASDVGVPTNVTAAAVPIGTKGVNFTFSAGNTLLIQGDQWSIEATAEALGAVTELILANSLPVALQGVNLKVELAILEDVAVPQNRLSSPPNQNWTTSATQIVLAAGIQAVPVSTRTTSALDVAVADAYVTNRALQTAIANQVYNIDDEASAQALLGADTLDAVLAYGTRRALAGAGGMVVKVLPIESDDLAGYQKAISILKERDDFYRIVPLTHAGDIHDAVVSEVNRRSAGTVGRWATTMLALDLVTEQQLVGETTDGAQSLATITDPLSGSNYIRLTDTSGEFITKGVKPGDIVRAKYQSDGFGGQTYTEFVVDVVVSEEELDFLTPATTPTGVPALYEIWHPMSLTEQAMDYGQRAAAFANRRVTVVFPPNPGRNGVRVPNYFLACTLAAYRGAAAPHQGLTNAAVPDWDDLEEASVTFADQLDLIANFGVYIITQSPTGTVFVRKQLTTDLTDTKRAEDSATVNVDSISYYFLSLLSPFIGRANVVPSAIKLIETKINQGIEFLVSDTFTEELGGQLTDADIEFIRPHVTFLDRVVVRLNTTIPIPLNNGEMDIVV